MTGLGSPLAHCSCHQQHGSRSWRGWLQHGLWRLQQLQLQTWGRTQNQRQLWQRVQGSPHQNFWQQLCNQKEGLQMKGRKLRTPSISSPSAPSQARKCCPCNHNPSPLPSLCGPGLGDTPVRKVQSWVRSATSSWTTSRWVAALNAETRCRLSTLPCGQLPAPLSPCAFLEPSLPRASLPSGWSRVQFSASPAINAQCCLILSVNLLPRMPTSARPLLTSLGLTFAFLSP